MKTSLISKENNIAKFTMEFTAEEFDAAIVKAYQNTKDRYPVDGFRKGKAPRKVIEARYGEGVFFEDAVNNMFSVSYPEAVGELNLAVIDDPKADFTELAAGKGYTVTIEVETYPEVEVKDYKGVEIEKVAHEITDEDINNEIEAVRRRNARMVVVERPAKEGDTVLLDYQGFLGDEQFEGGTAERFPLKLGSGMFIPGFEEQLIGVSTNEERDVNVTFPEDYQAEHLAGQPVVFKCKVHEVKEEELPEVNDEFVKDISEFDTLDEYKADVKANLEKAAAARAENEMKDAAVQKVCEANDFEAPNALVNEEIDARIREFEQTIAYQGINIDKYLEITNSTMDDLRSQIADECRKTVKTKMVLKAVAEAEKIEVSDEDINKECALIGMQYQMDAEKVREAIGAQGIGMVSGNIAFRKAVDLIFENAVIK